MSTPLEPTAESRLPHPLMEPSPGPSQREGGACAEGALPQPLPEGGERRIPCEVYSRVVGYYRPVQQWNVGKRQEWRERVVYRLSREGKSDSVE